MAFERHRPSIGPKLTPGPTDIASAKAAILNNLSAAHVADLGALRAAVLMSHSLTPITEHQLLTLPTDKQVTYLKWEAATRLALASLQAAGLIFPMTPMQNQQPLQIRITEATGPSSSQSGSLSFEEFSVLLAQKYRIAPKALEYNAEGFVLHDPDLYLTRINAPNMHVRVSTALNEAVECYRNDLFLAASVLLGSASEGACVQLAMAMRQNPEIAVPNELGTRT